MGTRHRLRLCGFSFLTAVILASCGPDWVQVQRVVAKDTGSTTIEIDYDICWQRPTPMPRSTVVESATEIRVTTMVKSSRDDSKACGSFENVALTKPIGARKIIDARRNREVHAIFLSTP